MSPKGRSLLVKRALDLAGAVFGLVSLAPVFVLLACWIRLEDGGPAFFRQERIGQGGEPFRLWKFRTMVPDAEKLGAQLTVGADRRITRPGRWLRRFKIDELPQLFNVLRGEMSLVGPRPEVRRYVNLYTAEQRLVLGFLPGITDPASIRFSNESEILASSSDPERAYVETILPEKIRLNLAYAAQATLWTDLSVVWKTLVRLIR